MHEADHLVPDLVLEAYLIEIDESLRAAEVLVANGWAHRAFPNVRTAYEAAQLLLLLVTADDYDLAGARAWLYYQRKDARYAAMNRPNVTLGDSTLDPDDWFDGAAAEIAETWNDFSPGKRAVVEQARRELEKQPRRPDNWAGVNVAPELQRRMNAMATSLNAPPRDDIASVLAAGYAAFARESHPRTRLKPSEIHGSRGGRVSFTLPDTDAHDFNDTIIVGGAGALRYAELALRIRVAMT